MDHLMYRPLRSSGIPGTIDRAALHWHSSDVRLNRIYGIWLHRCRLWWQNPRMNVKQIHRQPRMHSPYQKSLDTGVSRLCECCGHVLRRGCRAIGTACAELLDMWLDQGWYACHAIADLSNFKSALILFTGWPGLIHLFVPHATP